MAIPSLGSLAWHESWVGFGEGAFTLIAKLRGLNSVSKNYFVRQLHQSTGVSFVRGPRRRETPLEQRLFQASVIAQMGQIFEHLAGDFRFRYCKTCLNGGYQAALSQLDIFERCPIHDSLLLDRCSCCGEWTPRFDWSIFSRHMASFTCCHCGRPLAGGADLDKCLEAWALPDSLTKIESFHRWAIAASKRVRLVQPKNWITCAPGPDSDRRASLASVLSVLEQCTHMAYFRQTEIDLMPPVSMQGSWDRHSCYFVYGQIAAQLLPPGSFGSWTWTGWRRTNHNLPVPVETSVSVELHAAYIWRYQFEGSVAPGAGLGDLDNHLFDRFLRWRMDVPASQQIIMNDHLCWMLARAAWHAALRIAQAWRDYVAAATPGQRLLPLEMDWLSRLGRWDLTEASPLGFALRESPSGIDDLFLFLG